MLPVLLAMAGPALARVAVIPPAYRGEFSMERRFCGDDDGNEEARVFVTARTVGMYEATREVDRVMVTPKGLRLRFKPWARDYYADGFNPEEGLQPPDELVLSHGGMVLNRIYRRCPVKRKH